MKRLFAIILATSMALGMAAQAFTLPLPESINNWLWEKQSDSVAGTVYYVDSAAGNDANNGTSETTAWATLDKVNSTVFKPGDKILFKSGATFIGQLMPQGSGNEQEGPICIDKYGGDTLPIINSKGTGENFGAVISLLNQEYWEISNLELTAPSNGESARRVGVRVAAKDYGTVDHVYVTNCYIHDIACDIAKSPSGAQSEAGGDLWYGAGGGGISFLTVEGGDSIPSAFNDILVDNNIVKQVGRSGTGISISTANNNIYQQGYSFENDNADWFPNTNILISNNDVSYTSTAIFLSGCDGDIANGVTIENNLVYHPDNYDSNSGVWFALCNGINVQYNEVYALDNGGTNDCGAFDYDGGITNSIMQYNYTHHNRGEAVMVCNIHWSSVWEYNNTSDNIYRYNISENDLWGANKGHGRFWVQAGAQRSWFYNNVVYIAAGLRGNNIAVTGDSQDTYIYNNLFINLSDKTTWYVKDTATLYMDYNAYYGYAPTGDNWLPDNIKNYNDYYGTTVTSSFLGGENSVYMGLDDPLPIVGNEYIGKKIYTGKSKKDETGLRPTDYGMDIDTYLGGFKLNTEADWSDFGGKNPLIDAGKKIEHKNREGIEFGMGGKDFYENAVPEDEIPDIGAHETGSKGVDKTAPKMGNVTATATDFDEIKLTWSAAEDNVGISHYVIYVDQKAIGRVYATEGNNGSYTYTVNKLIGSTGPLVDYLLADTEYEIFVRAIDYTSNYDDSTVNTVKTESASAMESTLIISESSTWGCGSKKYDFNSNVKQSEFKS